MRTLYRKYRPQDFKEVFGQEAIVKVIKKQVADKRVGHAYVFAGPRGTGKTTIARLLAKAVNCQKIKEGNPCKRCSSCLGIEQGKFLDMIEIDAASNRGIDEIRRLRDRVSFSPSEGNFKVYIIDEVHMLTKDAFNALLKTLEEPPEHVIFILATTEPHKIPLTIHSRCQRFNFTLAEDEIIYERLKYICRKEKIKFSKDALMAIVKNSAGSFRDAESILEKVIGGIGVVKDNKVDIEDVQDILGLAEEREVKLFVEKLLEQDSVASLKIFDKVVSSGANLFQFLRQTLEYTRKLLLQRVAKSRKDFSLLALIKVITQLSEAESRVGTASVARLPVEVAIVKICSEEESESIIISRSSGKERKEDVQKQSVTNQIGGIVSGALSGIPQKIKTSFADKGGASKRVSLKEVTRDWNKIIEKIAPYNHHLSAFFKKAQPVDISGNSVVLHVPFRFHKQRIESTKGQEVFSNVTKEIVGVPLSCVCEVNGASFEMENEEFVSENDGVVLEVLGDIIE